MEIVVCCLLMWPRVLAEPSIGFCDYSDIAVFSFHPVKTVTTAEGGLY